MEMKQKINWPLDVSYLFVLFSTIVGCQPKQISTQSGVMDSSWAMPAFIKTDSINPIVVAGDYSFFCPIRKQHVSWEEKDVFNPAAVVREGKVFLLYRAEDKIGKFAGTSRIGLATSDDGLHFTKRTGTSFVSG